MWDIIASKLDKIANDLQERGLLAEAEEVDVISNTLEVVTAAANVDQALAVLGQASPQEIAQATKQLRQGKTAGMEVEAGKLGQIAAALALLAAAGGAMAGGGPATTSPENIKKQVMQKVNPDTAKAVVQALEYGKEFYQPESIAPTGKKKLETPDPSKMEKGLLPGPMEGPQNPFEGKSMPKPPPRPTT